MQAQSIRASIAALGTDLGPDILAACKGLFDSEQRLLARRQPCAASDLRYGAHERQRLDLYAPVGGTPAAAPILVFAPGGGFLRCDKGSAESWANANVGRLAAREGFLGAVIDYRLAPEHGWPAGGEDVAAVVDWLKANGAVHGGDPDRIVLMGTSAGAVHVATYLQLRPGVREARCAVLLSALYGITPLDERDALYYGDASLYSQRRPLEAVTDTDVPLLVACAEFDPPRFQAESLGLLQRRLERDGRLPRSCIVSGHNHYSLPMHLGTSDTRLADEVFAFARERCT